MCSEGHLNLFANQHFLSHDTDIMQRSVTISIHLPYHYRSFDALLILRLILQVIISLSSRHFFTWVFKFITSRAGYLSYHHMAASGFDLPFLRMSITWLDNNPLTESDPLLQAINNSNYLPPALHSSSYFVFGTPIIAWQITGFYKGYLH